MGKAIIADWERGGLFNYLRHFHTINDFTSSAIAMTFFSQKYRRCNGTGIVELIVSMTLFALLLSYALGTLNHALTAKKKTDMKEYLYTQAEFIVEELVRAIENNEIDYEEYYSRAVFQPQTGVPLPYTFGENYGTYHQQFFHPTTDYETGQNPYAGSPYAAEEGNAFCAPPNTDCDTNLAYHSVEGLFLINAEGNERLYYALEPKTHGEGYALAKVELTGSDEDQNGLIDTWRCAGNYTCNGPVTLTGNLPNAADLTDTLLDNNNFMPIAPGAVVVDDLTFFITPIEDPFKAFSEAALKIQKQPAVTFQITAHYQPYDNTGNPVTLIKNTGVLPVITLQSSAVTGIQNTSATYTP